MNSFKNKVVWITGASSGIGEALAMAMAKEGAKLILSSRRTDELERVKTSLHLPDEDVFVLTLDLANTSAITTLTQKVIEKYGRIDVLVNNGGVSQRALTKDTPLDLDRKIMEVNYFVQKALQPATGFFSMMLKIPRL